MNIPQEMIIQYLARFKFNLDECANALEIQDFSFLEKIGHQIKGNALSFGFGELTPMAAALESAAVLKDSLQLKDILESLNAALKKLEKRP